MCGVFRRILRAALMVGVMCLPVLGEGRLFLVPAGEEPTDYAEGPTEVTLRPWQSITFDIFLENTSPQPLRIYRVVLDSATGGETGSVKYRVGSAEIFQFRDDFPFFCFDCAHAVSGPPAEFYAALLGGGGVVISDPKYLGDLEYSASNIACGTFVIEFIDPRSRTIVLDADQNPIPFVAERTLIRMLDRADLNSDEQVNLLDILTVLDAFAGLFEPGKGIVDVDIASLNPCARDGVIDLFDILAVLDGFRGVDLCKERCTERG